MESYNHWLVKSKKKVYMDVRQDEVLDDLLGSEIELNRLSRAYVNSLKVCLEQEDLSSLLKEFFRMEKVLKEIEENIDVEINALCEFYQYLSPILLRVLQESFELTEKSEQSLKERCLEAVRVALEEEFYLWQEKLDGQLR